MRRWLILLVAVGTVVSAIVVWNSIRSAARRKRETGYIGALKAYSDALHPGLMRKDVEDYLRSRNTEFTSMWASFSDRRESQYADLVKIGEETAPWYCSEAYVYVAFEFLPANDVHRQTDSDMLQRIEIFRPYSGCL
jgi:hypothetical protein